jgi:hypothetical protein
VKLRSVSRSPRAALLIAAVLACPRSVRAQGGEGSAAAESKALIERALDLRESGHDEDALPLFERAFSLDPNPRTRAQLAFEHQALGRWRDAEVGLEATLAVSDDAWVQRYRPTLEKSLAYVQRQLGWIEVTTNVEGAEVSIDGAPAGIAPLPGAIRVPIGNLRVDVRAEGHAGVSREVRVVAGEHALVMIVLESESAPALASPPVSLPVIVGMKEEPPPSARPSQTAAWLALGGSIALLGGGVAASVVRETEVSEWNSPSCLGVGVTRAEKCGDHQSAANTAMALSIVGYASAGALAATSLALFLRHAPPSKAAWVAPRCGVGVLSAWCGGVF